MTEVSDLMTRIELAELGGAESMLLTMDELHSVMTGLLDTQRLSFIVHNWGMDLEEVRCLTDLAIETMPLR